MKNFWIKTNLIKTHAAQIQKIMDSFNFEEVQRMLEKIVEVGLPPTAAALRIEANNLLERVAAEDGWGFIGVECGRGFTAHKLPDGSLLLYYSLDFWGEQK
jgi:hypothetical protein